MSGLFYLYQAAAYIHYLQIQKTIQEKPYASNLITLTIPIRNWTQIHWKKGQKEFEYQGQLYDIASSKKVKDNLCYLVYKDVKEKRLNSKYNQKKAHNRPLEKNIPKIHISLFFVPPAITSFLPVIHHYTYHFYNKFLVSSSSEILSPPPKC
jgi:hypothetical protein